MTGKEATCLRPGPDSCGELGLGLWCDGALTFFTAAELKLLTAPDIGEQER